jgi:hypothetical protein
VTTTSAVPGTRVPEGYRADWALFTDWCAATGTPPSPAAVDTVGAFLAGCPAAPATAARRVAALLWHYRHSPTVGAAANPPGRRDLLGLPLPAPSRPLPDLDAVAAAVRTLPVSGWTGGFFGRRDAALLTLAATPLSWTALAALRTADVTVATGVLCLPGGELAAGDDPATCPPCVWLRWQEALALARREVSIRPLRTALDRAKPLTTASSHRCAAAAGSTIGNLDGPVFPPIDQHGYPDVRRALSATSLARLADRHLSGRPPFRRVIAPMLRRDEPAEPAPVAPPPPSVLPSAETLRAAHRTALDQRRDDLRQLAALDRLLDELERHAEQANERIAALAEPGKGFPDHGV